jgi:rubrerythrin
MITRRFVTRAGLAAAVALLLDPIRGTALAQTLYAKTRAVLGRSREAEVAAYRQYAAFTKRAKAHGYPGIAYLFTALATAQLIHGHNFERILARLGVEITPAVERQIDVGST